jgi:hypothetical protein
MQDLAVDRIYCGDMRDLQPPLTPIIRIYLSSTHTDMTMEKTELIQHIFPLIKAYCKDRHGLDFQVVDMRWGVRDEATDDHQTMALCREQQDLCRRTSLGPCFVLLMGQKYGHRPLPASLPAEHFELMLEGLASLNIEDGVKLLRKWFHKDANCVPAVYLLQPITSHLPNFLNSKKAKLQQTDQEEWFKTLLELQKYVLKGTEILKHKKVITEKEFLTFRMSVLEREFTKGIVEAEDTKEDCLAFTRILANMNMSDQVHMPLYLDTGAEGGQDQQGTDSATNLREEKLVSTIYKRNLKSYRLNWMGREGLSLETHDVYIREFVNDFYKAVIRLADRGAKKLDQTEMGLLRLELHGHLWRLKEAADWFVGREQEVEQLKSYITGMSRHSFVLYGPPGSGKTFLVACAVQEVRAWLSSDAPIVCARVLGTSPESCSLQPLLLTVCKQILYNLDMPYDNIPQEMVPLKTYFKQLLCLASVAHPIIIFFDCLETFFVDEHRNGGAWLPSPLPVYCKVVLTFRQEEEDGQRAGEEQEFLRALTHDGENLLALDRLGELTADRLVRAWLKLSGKQLTNYQFRVLLNAFSVCSVPLYCKLLYAEASKWRSYTATETTSVQGSIEACIAQLFTRIEAR